MNILKFSFEFWDSCKVSKHHEKPFWKSFDLRSLLEDEGKYKLQYLYFNISVYHKVWTEWLERKWRFYGVWQLFQNFKTMDTSEWHCLFELQVLNVDFLFTGVVNWCQDLSLILQACIKAEKDGFIARFWLAIFYCFKVVAVTPESGGSVVKNTSAVQEILIMGR